MNARAIVALVFAWVAIAPAPRAQDWRPAAVASFEAAWQTINDTFPDSSFGGLVNGLVRVPVGMPGMPLP